MNRHYRGHVIAIGVFLFALGLNGQEFRATITGRVTDPSSAAVPNAKVTAVLLSTGAKSETTSGADGLFTIPFLAPGTYRVEAQATGFKRYSRTNLEASAGERV